MTRQYKERKKTAIHDHRTANFLRKKTAIPKVPKSVFRIQQHKV